MKNEQNNLKRRNGDRKKRVAGRENTASPGVCGKAAAASMAASGMEGR
jgi:hypothetical protein